MSVCCVRKMLNVHFPTFRLSYFCTENHRRGDNPPLSGNKAALIGNNAPFFLQKVWWFQIFFVSLQCN